MQPECPSSPAAPGQGFFPCYRKIVAFRTEGGYDSPSIPKQPEGRAQDASLGFPHAPRPSAGNKKGVLVRMSNTMMMERTGMAYPGTGYPGVGTPVGATGVSTPNYVMVPRCTYKFENCPCGMKIWCACDDKT